MIGHVDGNFHVIFVVDPSRPEEVAEASRLNEGLIERALAMSGTCTGEHGVGLGKIDWRERELGEAVDLMGSMKRAARPAEHSESRQDLPARAGFEMSWRRRRGP
jgi:D-lactate dehydrogenase (cytochrome)